MKNGNVFSMTSSELEYFIKPGLNISAVSSSIPNNIVKLIQTLLSFSCYD